MSEKMDAKPYWSCCDLESKFTCWPDNLVFCCDRQSPGGVCPTENARETVDAFLQTRDRVILENQGNNPPCKDCPQFRIYEHMDGKIRILNLSAHSYCQFSCIYCDWGRYDKRKNKYESYDCLSIAQELKRRGLLSDSLHIECSLGEIAVHPKKNSYYDFIEENAASVAFFSNAGVFDERLAKILQMNQRNTMYTSIDAGTAETYQYIHGVGINTFRQVAENLKKYRKYSENIFLKYIIIKENCEEKDLAGFIDLCRETGIKSIILAADSRKTWNYHSAPPAEEYVVCAAIRLIELAITNEISFNFFSYYFGENSMKEIYRRLPQNPEIANAEKQLDKLLQAKKVIIYGAGVNLGNVMNQIEQLGLRKPDILWDIRGKKTAESGDVVTHMGYPLIYPDFASLSSSSDVGILITIANSRVNEDLLASMQSYGFTNVMPYDRLALALMAKQARKVTENA